MIVLSGFRRALLVTGLLSVASGASGETLIELPGKTTATLAWEAANGPVSGYYVIVERNGNPPTVGQIAAEAEATLTADYGDEVVVWVAAFDETGQAGPVSPPSPTLRFLPPAPTAPSDDPTDPPPSSEPDPTPEDPPTGEPPPAAHPAVAFDYTGDGISDLLGSTHGALELYVMDGARIVARQSIAKPGAGWSVAAHGDYDANGVADLVWRDDATGALLVWLVQDAAVIGSATLDLPHLADLPDWNLAGSTDLDADGHDDLVLHHVSSGAVELVLMQGSAIASTLSFGGYGHGWSIAATGDVDGDGDGEIVWLDEANRRLVLWQIRGDDVAAHVLTGMQSWRVIAAGDFDGDARADLFVQRRNPDRLAVWLLDGTRVREAVALPTPAVDSSLANAGDYDGNGLADLVFHDRTTSTAEIWFSTGSAVAREVVIDAGAPSEAAVLADETALQCKGDFNGDGMIGGSDFVQVALCVTDPSGANCALADVDGDGALTDGDIYRQRERYGWPACSAEGM